MTPEPVDLEAISATDPETLDVTEHGTMQDLKIEGTVPFVTAMEIARAIEKIMRKNHATEIIEKDELPGNTEAEGSQG